MNNEIKYNIVFQAVGDNKVIASTNHIQAAVANIDTATINLGNTFNKTVSTITNSIKTIKLSSVLDQIDRVTNGLNSLSQNGLALSSNMAELSAMTGVTGAKLKEIEGYARSNAKAFGGDAAASVESYKLVLSQLGPEIANVPAALKAMGDNVSVLSKTMGNDAVAATEVLTTAMNQYGVSLDDPMTASSEMSRMMNVMSAAAAEGSAELPQIQQALANAGMAAKAANVSFEETNAAIQVLDKAGKKGAEGGVAVRNVLATLSEGRFMPKATQEALKQYGIEATALGDKNKSFADRLNMLKPLLNDSALLTQVFGKENSNAALALIQSTGEMQSLTDAITGTNSAFDQAATIMESPAEKAARLKAHVDDLKIALFNGSFGILGYVGVLGDMTRDITNLMPLVSGMGTMFSRLSAIQGVATVTTKVMTVATKLLNLAFVSTPIGWIVLGIGLVIGAIVLLSSKFSWAAGIVGAAKNSFKQWGQVLLDFVLLPIKQVIAAAESLALLLKLDFSGAVERFTRPGREMVGHIKDATKATNEGYDKAVAEFEEKKYKQDLADAKGQNKGKFDLGIPTGVTVPGADLNGGGKTGMAAAGSAAGKSVNESIATGGTKNTTVNVSISKLIEAFNINQAASVGDDTSNLENRVVEAVTRAISMGASLATA